MLPETVPQKRLPGRPIGTGGYPGQARFLERLEMVFRMYWLATVAEAKHSRKPVRRIPTKAELGLIFEVNPRTLDYWFAQAGTTWAEQCVQLGAKVEHDLQRGPTNATE